MKELAEISRWVDDHPANKARSPEAQLWGRVSKVAEEHGETIQALIAVTGQNPRKPASGSMDQVVKELLDTAVTALAAVEHIDGNSGQSLIMMVDHILVLMDRGGLAVDPSAKRDLAAQLLRSANEAEGYEEGAVSEDAYVSGLPVTWAINEAHAKAIRKAYPDADVRVMGEAD